MKYKTLLIVLAILTPPLLAEQSTKKVGINELTIVSNDISILSEGNISTVAVEYSSTFSTAGDEIYYAKSDGAWGSNGSKSTIYHSVKNNDKWSIPKIASFSGDYDDSDPHLARDGKTLYFISNRPSVTVSTSNDIWKVELKKDGVWGDPAWLPYPINSAKTEYSPQTDIIGNLYFASDRVGGMGQGDLYFAEMKNDRFNFPINLGNTINSEKGEWNLGINANGDILIFEASQRKQNISASGDLYISFKQNDSWSIPQNIIELNTSGSDLYPYLSHNEKKLYYTSSNIFKGTDTNIYSTDFQPIYNKYSQTAKLSE